MSLLLACGWVATVACWWLGLSRRKRSLTLQSEAGSNPVSLREASRALRIACEENDSAAARVALLAWGQTLLMPRQVANLGELVNLLGQELAEEVEALNQSRYAEQAAAWQGGSLWALCERLQQQKTGATGSAVNQDLLPLNP